VLGYVLKSDAESDLLAAVDNARHHQRFFTNQLASSMMQSFVKDIGNGGAPEVSHLPLVRLRWFKCLQKARATNKSPQL
jgi:DNA-binding NarL/FixJ family response regulator